MPVTPEARRMAAIAGGNASRQRAGRLCIEGEHGLTVQAIAGRLGLTDSVAMKRLKREQAKPGPVTWKGLRA